MLRRTAFVLAQFLVILVTKAALGASLAGTTQTIAPVTGTAPVRWPAIAYDSGRYLAISGAGKVTGQFIGDDGALIGASFAINAGTNLAQAPRVTAAGGRFFVTWHETVGSATRIRGRFVTTAPIGDDFDVSPLGTNWEMGAASAFNGKELLVAWQNGATAVVAQRVGDAAIGAPIPIDTTGRYQRDPTVAALGSDFVVVYATCVADKNCSVEAQRVRDGALVGERIVLDTAIAAGYVPEAATNKIGDVLVTWYRLTGGAGAIHARLIHADGTLGPTSVVLAGGSYDANGVAYNPVSDTYLVVTHGTTNQDLAIELAPIGAPLGSLMFGAMTGGNFNPRVAANNTRPEFVAVAAAEFKTMAAQRFMTDAGAFDSGPSDVGVADAAVSDTAADATKATDATTATDEPLTGGCGCTTAARSQPSWPSWLSYALLVFIATRRRR